LPSLEKKPSMGMGAVGLAKEGAAGEYPRGRKGFCRE